MKKPITGIINSYYPSLTHSEQKVADYVLNHLQQVIYFSVTDLADEANVGETTVLRFCRKIGLKGYQAFKLTVAQNLSEASKDEEASKSTNMVQTIKKNIVNGLEHTATMAQEEHIHEAINMLHQAQTIHFFGVGTSGITAQDAQSRFLRVGKHTQAITDSHMQAMAAATIPATDVAVGLSISGSTRDTIDALKMAKENGAKTIAITYYTRSPITQYADIVLPGGMKESPLEGGSLSGKVAQLFMVDLLWTGLVLLEKEARQNMQEKTANAVVNKIY